MNIQKECLSCILEKLSSALHTPEKAPLFDYCDSIAFKQNDIIFRQDMPSDSIIYIKEGLVKVIKETGRETKLIFKLLKGPAFLGISSAFGSHYFNFSAYSVSDTKACLINKQWFIDTMEKNGKFARKLLEINCHEETESTNRLLTLLRKQVPGRMADVLQYFSNHIFLSNEFDLPLSRDEMADYIGVSKKSFIRTLSEFKHDKIISVEGKRVKIMREDLLQLLSKMG